MRFRVYIAMSLDGYIATADGGVEWLEPFGDEDYGYASFIEEIGSVVMGRVTFEQVRDFGDWPYDGMSVRVLTSGALDDPPPGVVAWSGSLADLERQLDAEGEGADCWVVGGGQTIRGFDGLNLIDEYELFIMPVVLGDGVPLFPKPYPPREIELRSVTAWDNGVVRLRFGSYADVDSNTEREDDVP